MNGRFAFYCALAAVYSACAGATFYALAHGGGWFSAAWGSVLVVLAAVYVGMAVKAAS